MVMLKKRIRIKYVLACWLIIFCFIAIFNQAVRYAAEGDPISSEIFLDTINPDDAAPEVEMGDNYVTLISKQADVPDENDTSSGIKEIEYGYRITGSGNEYIWQSSPEIYGLTLGQSYDFVTRAYDYAQNMTISSVTSVTVRKNTRPQFKVENVINVSTYNPSAIKASDRVNIRLKVVSSELASTNLTVEDIVIRVGEDVINPTTKKLSNPINTDDGVMWDLTVLGLTGNGNLYIEIPEGVAVSNFSEENKVSILDTQSIIDNITPSDYSVVINDGSAISTNKNVKLSLEASGVESIFINNTGLTPAENDNGWIEFSETKYHDLLGNTGTNTVYVWFKDSAGNIVGPATDTIELTTSDTEPIQATIFFDDQAPDSTAPNVSTSNGITKIICMQKDIYKDSEKSGVVTVEYGYRVHGTEEFTWTLESEIDNINETNEYDFVTKAYDAAGNSTISEIKTVSIVENTTPVVTFDKLLNISTYNPSYIKSSDRIQIIFRAKTLAFKSSALTADDIIIQVGGQTVEPTLKELNDPVETLDGVKWTLTLSGVSGEGVLSLIIPGNKVLDVNYEGNVETILNTGSVVDNTAPANYSILINNGDENTVANNVNLSISATGADYMYISNEIAAPGEKNEKWREFVGNSYHTLVGENGSNSVYVWFKDIAGNIAGYATDSINVTDASEQAIHSVIFLDDAVPDTTAPSINSINRSIKITCNQKDVNKDGVKSGIVSIRYGYKVTGSADDYTWQTSDIIGNIAGDISYDFVTEATDYAGNKSVSQVVSMFVEKDTTPIFILDYKKNISTNNSLYAKASDIVEIGFNVDSSRYYMSTLKMEDIIIRVGGTELTDVEKNLFVTEENGNGQTWKLSLTNISGNGELLIEIPENKALDMDGNGNVTTILEANIIVDNIAPEPNSIKLKNDEAQTILQNVLANISSTGARYMYLSNDTTAPTEFSDVWTEYTNSRYHQLTDGYGEKTVYAWFKDEAGNISEMVSDTIEYVENTGAIESEIFLDTLAPTTDAPEVLVSTNAIILCHQEDQFADGGYKSGIVKIEYGYRVSGSTDEYTWQDNNLLRKVPAVDYYEFVTRATDAAGNSSISEATVQYVDITEIHVDVIFDAQGGRVSPMIQTYIEGATYIDLPEALCVDKTFVSWNTKADGTGTTITDGTELISSYNHTLYAQYIDIVDISNHTISLNTTTFVYDGNPKTPIETIVVNGKTLEKDKHYTVTYSNNVNVGTATVTVTGIGNYIGTLETNFTITPATPTLTVTPDTLALVEGNSIVATINYDGDGMLSVEPSIEGIVTYTLNGKKLNITGVTSGTTTFRMTLSASLNYFAKTIEVPVTVSEANYGIGDISYTTLEEAIAGAVNGDTIKVLQNVLSDTSNPIVDKNIKLDTNGFTVTKETKSITVDENGTLDIIGNGTIKGGTNFDIIVNNGTVTINSGILESKRYAILNNSVLNINGGTVQGEMSGINITNTSAQTVIGNVSESLSNSNPAIIGGEYGIEGQGTVIFNNGTIKGTNVVPYSVKVIPRTIEHVVEVSGPENGMYSAYLVEDKDVVLITEWTIPVDADGTTKEGTTIKLPVPTATTNNYVVDWGDGEIERYETEAFPTHTYKNTETKVYTIKVSGKVNQFGCIETSEITDSNTYKDYYTYTQYITGLKAWGELGATRYGFSQCTNLTGTIPVPTENSFKSITDMSNLFYNCSYLSGTIPQNFFAQATETKGFNKTFSGCKSLNGTIQTDFFANNTKVTSFAETFKDCILLSGSIPATLFSSNTEATDFTGTFENCSTLNGTIPASLFTNNTKVTTFANTFKGCMNLTGTISSSLFAANNLVEDFSNTFNGCSKLSGLVPAQLFINNTKASNFTGTFEGCSSITACELQLSTDVVTQMDNLFKDCTALESIVFSKDFKNLTGADMFLNASALRAIILLQQAETESEIGTISNMGDLGLTGATVIYVPYAKHEELHEKVWTNIPTENIQKVVQIVPPNPDYIQIHGTYKDPGYTVAGFSMDEAEKYTQYGFYVIVTGMPVDTSELGSEWIKYTLRRD